jgi:hypothetical protein
MAPDPRSTRQAGVGGSEPSDPPCQTAALTIRVLGDDSAECLNDQRVAMMFELDIEDGAT